MDRPSVNLLDIMGNFALAQVNGRRFPGLLVQGDTLRSFQEVIHELGEVLQGQDAELMRLTLAELAETIDAMVASYEAMMAAAGLDLPYFR